MYRSSPVQLLRLSLNCRRHCSKESIRLLQHAIERVERPGGSQEASDGKKNRQSMPERILRWLPLCTVAFSNLVAAFHSCLASHPLLICLGHRLLIRLCIFRRHGGLDPIVSGGNPHGFVWFLFGVAPAPFCVVSLFFCWRNANLAGRFAGRRCCRFLFVLVFCLCFHDVPQL